MQILCNNNEYNRDQLTGSKSAVQATVRDTLDLQKSSHKELKRKFLTKIYMEAHARATLPSGENKKEEPYLTYLQRTAPVKVSTHVHGKNHV